MDELRILADRIAAGAILAIDWADRGDEKQDFVRIAVHDARDGGVLALGERIDLETGMVILLLAAHRQKLTTDRVPFSIGPIDQREHVRIEPDRHAAPAQAGL